MKKNYVFKKYYFFVVQEFFTSTMMLNLNSLIYFHAVNKLYNFLSYRGEGGVWTGAGRTAQTQVVVVHHTKPT